VYEKNDHLYCWLEALKYGKVARHYVKLLWPKKRKLLGVSQKGTLIKIPFVLPQPMPNRQAGLKGDKMNFTAIGSKNGIQPKLFYR
jgi:hypothetical protein